MKKKKFTETQIVAILKQYEGGREAMDVDKVSLLYQNRRKKKE